MEAFLSKNEIWYGVVGGGGGAEATEGTPRKRDGHAFQHYTTKHPPVSFLYNTPALPPPPPTPKPTVTQTASDRTVSRKKNRRHVVIIHCARTDITYYNRIEHGI